ncbi:flagellar protein FlgN [Pectinatus haikarae]|uniref:flagellar protein FlgN n=1 Tax=Pectinatus haikarae TaxID=349096 RepID=UPI0018C69012|nr:flagellar protein FlgN [Pectinatus haikarae]
MWQNLIDTIIELMEMYNCLFILNEKKRKAVLDIDMSALNKIVETEQELTGSVIKAEQKRQKILKQMAAENSGINENSNAKTLLAFCPQTYKESFSKANNDLSANVEKVSSINETNRLLLQGALTAVNMNINSLAGIKADPGYEKSGNQNFSSQKKKFDFQA